MQKKEKICKRKAPPTAQKYVDGSGRVRYKGTDQLKKSQ